jgi:CDP-diacylglycerol--glycerol-3-phosphate 3-phosphatidyltransferase
MKREFLTISNLLSISRAVLVVPFVLLLTLPPGPRRGWAIGVLALAALTDRLDGDLARARNEVTEWGKILDPLADKICVAGGAAALVAIGSIPLWFLVAVASRDLLILAGGLILKARRGMVLPSNRAGKWTVGMISLSFLAALLGAQASTMTVFLLISSGGLVVSFTMYALRFAREVQSAHTNVST